ncbi:MAG TPA: c-type cytochrome biogenesis protein CcmI [Caulobacteraceae bacterium]|nr:c-type cytochrome biogenesis protein CcmI [Caulobacteraceae bacterium]
MALFWIVAALLSAAAALLVLRRAARPEAYDAEAPEAAVYRRHLSELDELKARGLLDEDGWRAARAEAGRRLLSASEAGGAVEPRRDPRRERTLVLAGVAGAAAAAVGLYVVVGRPGAPDQPYAARVEAWRAADPATLDPPRMAAVLEQIAVERPQDPQVWSFLGRARAQAGDKLGAATAFERAVRLEPASARHWAALGEAFVQLSDGQVGADAKRAFEGALQRDPYAPAALYYLGKAEVDEGRREQGLERWRVLAGRLQAGDPRRAALTGEIARVERGGETAAQAVASAPAQEQAAAIRGMVEGLAARLQADPYDPNGWARLVRSYRVLGDEAAAARALTRARALFRERSAELAKIEAAAKAPPS